MNCEMEFKFQKTAVLERNKTLCELYTAIRMTVICKVVSWLLMSSYEVGSNGHELDMNVLLTYNVHGSHLLHFYTLAFNHFTSF